MTQAGPLAGAAGASNLCCLSVASMPPRPARRRAASRASRFHTASTLCDRLIEELLCKVRHFGSGVRVVELDQLCERTHQRSSGGVRIRMTFLSCRPHDGDRGGTILPPPIRTHSEARGDRFYGVGSARCRNTHACGSNSACGGGILGYEAGDGAFSRTLPRTINFVRLCSSAGSASGTD